MKKTIKIFICLFALCLLIAPLFVSADMISLTNPLKHDTVESLLSAIIDFLWWTALIISPIFILYAGFLFITSAGDPAKVKKAGQVILFAAIGLLIIGFSKGIVEIIQRVAGVKEEVQVETQESLAGCMARTGGNYSECSSLSR